MEPKMENDALEKDWDVCDDSEDGKHEVDPLSAQQAPGCPMVVDYNCKHCGQSAGVSVALDALQWS
jgi:hypothetical protein